jgi:hypothetical protein
MGLFFREFQPPSRRLHGGKYYGLFLPREVLAKVYRGNAERILFGVKK